MSRSSWGGPRAGSTSALHVAESGYYAWHNRPPSNRLVKHAWLTEAIVGIHTAFRGTYGSRRVHAELGLGLRIHVSHGTVELLMQRAPACTACPATGAPAPSTSPHPSPTSWSGTSPATPGTSYGSPTAPNTPPSRARCTARSSWTRSRDALWAGRSTPRPPRR
ncbi:IS3 family transposase [Streptomyces sp. NPDC087859]|uniref:IS3 family transposase n=1 Tax=Streptomyces sp. NPDC087859 TaxID=3365812 RepID=UPI0038049C4A